MIVKNWLYSALILFCFSTGEVKAESSITFVDSTQNKDALELLFYDTASYKEHYEICRNFQDNYVTFQHRIDKDLENNFEKYKEATNLAADKIAKCKGLENAEVEKLRIKAENEYNSSNSSQMTKIRAGHVFTEPGEDSELVTRCNLMASSLLKDVEKYNTLELDDAVCQ